MWCSHSSCCFPPSVLHHKGDFLWNLSKFSESSVGRLLQYLQFPGPSPPCQCTFNLCWLDHNPSLTLLVQLHPILVSHCSYHKFSCKLQNFFRFLGQLAGLKPQHSNGFKKSCELAIVCIPFYITVNSEPCNCIIYSQTVKRKKCETKWYLLKTLTCEKQSVQKGKVIGLHRLLIYVTLCWTV